MNRVISKKNIVAEVWQLSKLSYIYNLLELKLLGKRTWKLHIWSQRNGYFGLFSLFNTNYKCTEGYCLHWTKLFFSFQKLVSMCRLVMESRNENKFGPVDVTERNSMGDSSLSIDCSAELHSIADALEGNRTDGALVEITSAGSAGPSHVDKLPVFLYL